MTESANVGAVAAFGLPSRHALPEAELHDYHWAQLLGRVRDERLIGILAHTLVEGALPATAVQASSVAEKHTEAMAQVLLLERILLEVTGWLEAAAIPYIVFKGPALAHTIYPDASMRSYGDIDLLVPGRDVARTVAIFEEHGCHRHYPEIRRGFDRRFGKSVTMLRPDGVELDLHRTFVPGRYGLTVELDRLFESIGSLHIGGRSIPILDPPAAVVAGCYNAALGDPEPRLMTLRDVAQLCCQPGLDEQAVLDVARSWRAEAVVARAIRLAWEALALTSATGLSSWAGDYRPSRTDARALASYTTARSSTSQTLSALGAVPRVRDKAALVAAVIAPDRGYLERLGPDPRRYLHWWRRGVRSLRRAVSRA